MKSYGQIANDAFIRHYFKKNVSEKELDALWAATPDKAPHEASALAVIEEFKRRHNIVIPPEED